MYEHARDLRKHLFTVTKRQFLRHDSLVEFLIKLAATTGCSKEP